MPSSYPPPNSQTTYSRHAHRAGAHDMAWTVGAALAHDMCASRRTWCEPGAEPGVPNLVPPIMIAMEIKTSWRNESMNRTLRHFRQLFATLDIMDGPGSQ